MVPFLSPSFSLICCAHKTDCEALHAHCVWSGRSCGVIRILLETKLMREILTKNNVFELEIMWLFDQHILTCINNVLTFCEISLCPAMRSWFVWVPWTPAPFGVALQSVSQLTRQLFNSVHWLSNVFGESKLVHTKKINTETEKWDFFFSFSAIHEERPVQELWSRRHVRKCLRT